ncbi:hypothetical protein QIS99_28725 [Streptomyces sp. B-S-A8]|uniref:ESX-1 secretion-associated protein n=1 Tax=Streptomyces solicavernae TaxID=3043614 RepID=A0ABT6S0D8_9ACTN|nr:hypothetical protein [Streptomyces sp. B-S-A8]MDI3390145.1 hypothetical protein [Streptomyces sp. B-S-A8]
MSRPLNLSSDDYSPDDRAELPALMTDLTAQLAQLLTAYAPEGTWAFTGDVLDELRAADELLDQASRAISSARSGVRRIDGRARSRFLDRTIHHKVPAST